MRTQAAGRLAILWIVVGAPATSEASSWAVYGFGPRASALAGSVVAAVDDGTATFYNPAGLLGGSAARLHVGVDGSWPAVDLDFDRPDPSPAPRDIDATLGLDIGLAAPLGGVFDGKVALGLGVHHPLNGGTRIEALDPARPQLLLHQSLPDKVLIAPAVAVELTPWLVVGAGVQILAFIEGAADATVSLGAHRFTETDLRVDVHANKAPTAGVSLRLSEDLRLGAAYRHGLDFSYDLPLQLHIEEIGALSLHIEGVALFTPPEAEVGAAWQVRPGLLLLAGAAWAGWSQCPDPAAEVIVDLSGGAVGRGELVHAESVPVDLGAQDVVIPRLGVEWSPAKDWTLRAGAAFRPTPLPTPTGRTNYVDAPTLITGLGGAWRWVEVAAQASWLLPRRVAKRDPADPVGDYRAGGPILRISAGVARDL